MLAWPVDEIMESNRISYEELHASITHIAACRETVYSYENTVVAEVDDKVVGAMCGYDGADYQRLKQPIIDTLGKDSGFAELMETEEEAVAPAEPSNTPARDAMRQMEREEGRRRRAAAVEVPDDETLRVAPVDQRPEFIAQGKVDDSQTRIFGGLAGEMVQEEIKHAAKVETVHKVADLFAEAPVIEEKNETPADEAEQTIRLSRDQIEEIRQQQEPREDKYAGRGKKKDEIKPMKKQKKGFLFGKKKAKVEDEDDFVEDFAEGEDYDDEDLFE